MAIDASDNIHIIKGNMYATNASGSWANEMVESESDSFTGTDIAIDSSGKVHICRNGNNLKYTTNALPVPDVKVNNADDYSVLTNEDVLSVTASLYTGNRGGENADWWILADTPSGWYHYDMNSATWLPGQEVSYQGPLFEISSLEILNTTGLPSGRYTCSFTIDMIMNGILDSDYSYADSVEVDITEKDRFAIDLDLASAMPPRSYGPERPVIFIGNEGLPSIAGKELTIEAWVKKSDTDSFYRESILTMDNAGGGLFTRDYQMGFRMFLSDNKPSFNITHELHEPEPLGCTSNYPTSTATCVVNSSVSILNNIWTHIAGVLVHEEHVHPESESCTPTVMSEKPHLDLYVNGNFENCATSGEQFAGDDPNQFMTIGSRQYCLGCGVHSIFYGTLDEIRVWTVARTEQEIRKCMNFELGTTPECPIDSTVLKGYWNFNEGQSSVVNDTSGNGLSGVIEITPYDYADYIPWDKGWVPGYQFLVNTVPDIKANGSDGPLTITQGNTLLVTVELDAGSDAGENADWWVVADTPFDWFRYNIGTGSWQPGMSVTYQGPLFDLNLYEVLNMTGLPLGSYAFYFGVDMNMNGSIDMGQIYYDSVVVTITP